MAPFSSLFKLTKDWPSKSVELRSKKPGISTLLSASVSQNGVIMGVIQVHPYVLSYSTPEICLPDTDKRQAR
jgi:hypothetical protein